MEKKYTPAEVLAAARVLFPDVVKIERLTSDYNYSMKCETKRSCASLAYPNIDWQGLDSYEEPKPWRPAEWPKDWGKMARFGNSELDLMMMDACNSVLIGKHIDRTHQWIAESKPGAFKHAWVRDE